jgi:hypothetical protein
MLETERRSSGLGRRASDHQREQELHMLRAEIEMLINERDNLLRATGAAALFVTKLDSQQLPKGSYEAADLLAATINALPEETLRDALEIIQPQEQLA